MGQASATPYPPSQVIEGVTWDFSSHISLVAGSDNWPMTWADNDHQYTVWGDGGGFRGDHNNNCRTSLGIARVEGNGDGYQGHDIWGCTQGNDLCEKDSWAAFCESDNPTTFKGKSYGIISINGVLYMWVTPGSGPDGYTEVRLAKSTDYGANWTFANWAFLKSQELVVPTILQFGKDNAEAIDNYVYSYAIRLKDDSALMVQKPGEIDLLRVPKDNIMNQSSYQFFTGLDQNGNANWISDVNQRKPVFKDPTGVGWSVSAIYNKDIDRYFLITEHTESLRSNLGIYDAPAPWGPWTTVARYTNWGNFDGSFFWNIAPKWISGKEFTMIFTGVGIYDSWNTVKGTFVLKDIPFCLLPDFNCSRIIGGQDLDDFVDRWSLQNPEADFNDDSIVNTQDLGIMMSVWGTY